MMRINRLDECLSGMNWPQLQKIESLNIGGGDVLVVCAGFEDRAIATLRAAQESNSKGFDLVLIHYQPVIEQNKYHQMIVAAEKCDSTVVDVEYNREEPQGFACGLVDQLERFNKVWIDVSGMSRLLVVQLVVALKESGVGLSNCFLLYAEALHYPPSEDDVTQAWENLSASSKEMVFLSSGVFDVCVVPELSSIAMHSQPIRLVAFPSFNTSQMLALRSAIQPSFVSLINGTPPSADLKWRTNQIRKLNEIEKIPHHEELYTSTLDYRETIQTLLEIYKKYADFEKLVLSPTGSKMQAVAVAIIRAYFSDIQIVYPTPRSFIEPEQYTSGVKALYKLDLSEIDAVFRDVDVDE